MNLSDIFIFTKTDYHAHTTYNLLDTFYLHEIMKQKLMLNKKACFSHTALKMI